MSPPRFLLPMVSVSQTETERENTEVSKGAGGRVCSHWDLLVISSLSPHPHSQILDSSSGRGPGAQGPQARDGLQTGDFYLFLQNRTVKEK